MRSSLPSNRFGLRPTLFAATALTLGGAMPATAQSIASATPFALGAVTVNAQRAQIGEIREDQVGSVLTDETMRRFNRDNVADAVTLLPGVTLANNSRNEKTISVRGFDMRQVPVYIDGIPVYVPYDGYLDLNRFTTADLAAIQVAKGFSSVSYGANALGGAINLVSRKPVRVLEGDARAGWASGNERQTAVNVGSQQGSWYLQAGASSIVSDSFPLPDGFVPTTTEDGGARNNAYRQDSKVSFKLGLTPDAHNEFTLSGIRQSGAKGQPPSTDPAAARYWQWPSWNKSSLYLLSRTALGTHETLRLRYFRDVFDNEVDTFTDASYRQLKTSGTGSVSTGKSLYDDESIGGSLELESRRWDGHGLKLVLHDKQDLHRESDANDFESARLQDRLQSWGVEDSIVLGERWTLALGYARNTLSPQGVFSAGNAYTLPAAKSASNVQAGLYFDPSSNTRLYATVAQKSRLPTLKDRYSQRLGSYVENPALQAETARNFELGYQGIPWTQAKVEAALFRSEVDDKIQSTFLGATGSSCTSTLKCQMQNIGRVAFSGLEASVSGALTPTLHAGVHATWLRLENLSQDATRITDVPEHSIGAHLRWLPTARWELVGTLESSGARWASNTLALEGYTLVHVKAVLQLHKSVSAEFGVNNATDRSYALAAGFPSPGRTAFFNANFLF